jgi:hypothetical protein
VRSQQEFLRDLKRWASELGIAGDVERLHREAVSDGGPEDAGPPS